MRRTTAACAGSITKWPNSIAFRKSQNDLMEKVSEYVNGQLHKFKSSRGTVVEATLSPADELKKFKDLLDMGVITQDEFDAKKKQLLGI